MASEIIGIAGLFITLIVFVVTYFKTRHAERMALINSDKTTRIFDVEKTDTNGALKLGLMLLSAGLGLCLGMIFDYFFDTEPAGVFVCILILGGMSLIFYHSYVDRKSQMKPKDEDQMV